MVWTPRRSVVRTQRWFELPKRRRGFGGLGGVCGLGVQVVRAFGLLGLPGRLGSFGSLHVWVVRTSGWSERRDGLFEPLEQFGWFGLCVARMAWVFLACLGSFCPELKT